MRFRAYLFDVQGTLLDFFNPVNSAVGHYFTAHGIEHVDAAEFTRSWREDYFQRLRSIPQSLDKWRPVQSEYLAGFSDVCLRYGLPAPDHAVFEAAAYVLAGAAAAGPGAATFPDPFASSAFRLLA